MKLSPLLLAALLGVPQFVYAETIDLGWTYITPCSTVEWNNNGPLGLPAPTYRSPNQRATLRLDVSSPNFVQAQNQLNMCAQQGVAAATLASLITNLSGAAPAFWATFQGCAANIPWANANLHVDYQCE